MKDTLGKEVKVGSNVAYSGHNLGMRVGTVEYISYDGRAKVRILEEFRDKFSKETVWWNLKARPQRWLVLD